MATVPEDSPILEVRHKSQQSHDSGAYIDWSVEESTVIKEQAYQSNVTGEFVTVVAVETANQIETQEKSFVTVLSIGDTKISAEPVPDSEEVLVYRLPGERLGFGLKFEGGLKTAEKVSRLFIQSCAPDSPASRTRCSWGPLSPGDEILEIDGVAVRDMTRIDCVRSLKESHVVIKLRIRPACNETVKCDTDKNEKQSSPPPIPPRKVPRKSGSFKETTNIVCPPDGFADNDNSGSKEPGNKNYKSSSPREVCKNNHDDVIRQHVPEAEVYMDLIAKESETLPGESESDDTGSSISTVVDRLSSAPTTSNSSFSDVRSITSLDITTPPTPTSTNTCPTFDLDRVLEPFLQLEREFSSSATIDESSLFNKLVAAANFTETSHTVVTRTSSVTSTSAVEESVALQPPASFQDGPGFRESVDTEVSEELISKEKHSVVVMKTSPRKTHNVVLYQNLEIDDENETEMLTAEDIELDAPALPPKPSPRKDLSQKSKFKSGKKRPPPPPPPRFDRPCPNPPNESHNNDNESDEFNDTVDGIDSQNETIGHHLPRLIDFVPKDRTDVLVPNVIHPENSQQNHMEILIQRQRLLEMVNSKPGGDHDESCEHKMMCEVGSVRTEDEHGHSDTTSDGEEHCANIPMCVPALSDDESDVFPGHSTLPLLSTIGEDEEEPVDDRTDIKRCVEYVENTPTEANGGLERDTGDNTRCQGTADVDSLPIPCKPLSDENLSVSSPLETTPSNGVDEKLAKSLDSGVYGAMDASATATLSLSPPPSFSRMPPDGHEFPPNYQEPCPDPITSPNLDMSLKMIPPPLPTTAPPPITKKKPTVRTSLEIGNEPITNAVRKFSTCSSVSSTDEVPVRPSTRSSAWRNDEKSERSVRDKIAMFSNVTDESPISPVIAPSAITLNRKLNRFKSSEDVFSQTDSVDCSSGSFPSGKLFSRSVLSVDKVASHTRTAEPIQSPRKPMKKSLNYNSMMDVTQVAPSNHQNKPSLPTSLEFGSRTQSSMDLTSSSSSSSAYSSCSPDSSLTSTTSSPYMGYSSTLPRKSARENERKSSLTSSTAPSLDNNNKPTLTRAMSFTGGNKLHSRSQSLVDVNAPLVNKYVPNSVTKGNSEEARRASLNALIEQRRRSISKLRGLVIPERVAEVTLPQPIIDLPEIKSRDSVMSKMCPPVAEEPVRRLSVGSTGRAGTTSSSPVCANYINAVSAQNNLTSPPWKSQTPVSDLPKYSPAFKRKSLAVYGAPSSASSVSSSLSSSREELRPLFENNNTVNVSKPVNNVPPTPPSKPPRTTNRQAYSSQSTVLPLSPTLSHTEPPKSLESITSPTRSDMSFEFVSSSGSSPDVKMMKTGQAQFEEKTGVSKSNNYKNGIHEPQVMPLIKLTSKHRISTDVRRSGGEESDNDSAVSSSRSSISHDYSPPQSPLPDNSRRLVDEDSTLNRSHTLLSPSNSTSSGDRRTLRRTLSSETTASAASSTASTLTSGSQASCSSSSTDSMSRRVLKAQSVEAINRKNVLSSARFSSGQDLKVGSPLIQRKFDENNELSKNLNYSDNSSFTADTAEESTESFINKLNKTLQKEEHNDVEQSDDSIDKAVISYQLTNKEYTLNTTKVAYLEVEVVDGAFSSQEDSSFIDSNPSSMEHLDSEPVPVPREICPENENILLNVNVNTSDSSNDNKTEAKKEIFNECLTDHYQPITKSLSKLLDEEEIVVPKPMIKRLSRDHKINCDITTSVVPDNTHKTASVEFLNNEKNSEEKECALEEKIIPEVPPKPTQRMTNLDYIPDSPKKEELTEVETDSGKQCSVTNRVKEQNISPISKIPTASMRNISNRRSVSVNDIRKAFEKAEMSLGGNRVNKIGINGTAHQIPSHARVSSLDSTTSEDSCAPTPTHYGSITNLQKEQQFGSITSLASSTSLISQQELQQLIDDANQTLEETGGCSHEVVVVILHRDTAGGSIGITLAGGADYESKEITVHKVLAGSPADRDGRIQKGDRILSINGRSMKGVSHRESLAILKAPRPEVVLVVSRWRPDGYIDSTAEDPLVLSLRNTLRPPRIPEQLPEIPSESPTNEKVPEEATENISRGPPLTVTLVKDGAGLGFSLEGGKDSPFGDQPLTIKKIFTGGCAEKSGELFAGDELLNVNGTDVTTMSRIEAWGLMKRLADGKVVLSVRHKVANSGQ